MKLRFVAVFLITVLLLSGCKRSREGIMGLQNATGSLKSMK